MSDYLGDCESPIERDFSYHLQKYLHEGAEFYSQYPVDTPWGSFRIDFVVVSPAGEICGFECDGKEYHDERRDTYRDAAILGSTAVQSIFRISGSDIHYYVEGILYLLSRINPDLFSERAHIHLRILASDLDQANLGLAENNGRPTWALCRDERGSVTRHLFIEWKRKHVPHGQREVWQSVYRDLRAFGPASIDRVMAELT